MRNADRESIATMYIAIHERCLYAISIAGGSSTPEIIFSRTVVTPDPMGLWMRLISKVSRCGLARCATEATRMRCFHLGESSVVHLGRFTEVHGSVFGVRSRGESSRQ